MHLNRKYITIVGTIAAVLVMGAMFALPTMAAPKDKVAVCHFSDSPGWHVINISGNALKGHIGPGPNKPHSDKGFGETEQFDSQLNGFTDSQCLRRNDSGFS